MGHEYEILQITNLSEDMLIDCYHVASMSRPAAAEEIAYTLQRNVNERGHIMFVVMKDMFLRGFISGHLMSNHGYAGEAEIDWLFVDVRYQRRGIGDMLMRAWREYCREHGIGRIKVRPAPTVASKQFYAKQGFERQDIIYMVRNTIKVR
ncbi:GNAT family N-acetyltransferase [bacterium]|nr:GNAT family N-acetyltransferase [bacterium]